MKDIMNITEYRNSLPNTMLPNHKEFLVRDYQKLQQHASRLGVDTTKHNHQSLINLFQGKTHVHNA